jgi:N-acetyl-gamma-glutamyl-phosphate reductase
LEIKELRMKAGIIGASGYTGAELLRIIHGHDGVDVAYITAHTYAGQKVVELYPNLHTCAKLEFEEFEVEKALSQAELFFVALPHGKAMEVVPSLLEGGAKVVDLSADYRLSDPHVYMEWYGLEHTSPALLDKAAYGLPEIFRDDIAGTGLVAVAGCYPTAAILALAPLASHGYTGVDGAIVDAKSGLSGAGRALSLATHFAQADENIKPYNVGKHRHTPEMDQILSTLADSNVGVTFTPHLAPMSRGILATCYVRVEPGATASDINELYEGFYADCPFIVLLGSGSFPETKAVTGSNYCHIGWHLDAAKGMLTVASALDNLVKGASGQAIQCMNVMMGWSEDTGLRALGIFP